MGAQRRQFEMLFEATNAVLQFADLNAVPDDRGMIFDQGAANAPDLLASFFPVLGDFLAHVQQVRGDVGPK